MSPAAITQSHVYCNKAHYVPVSGGRAEAGFKGAEAVVGSVVIGPGGYTNGGSDGRIGFGG